MILLASAAVRVHLLDVPLDRDEGEYAYIGRLILDGVPPYAHAYNMKMPGIYALYAAGLALFGKSPSGVHLGLLIVTSLTTVLVFLLARRLFDARVGVTAAVAFAVLALNPHMLGLAAYAEHFVLPAITLGTLILMSALDRERLALVGLAGVLFGVGFVIKQSGGAFAGFGLAWIFYRRLGGAAAMKDHRRALWEGTLLLAGALVPLAAVSAVLLASGTFANFWFWTFRYAAQYGAGEPMRDALWNLGHSSREFLPAVWPVVAAAVIALLLLARDRELRRNRAFAVLLIVFSSLAVLLTGFHLRHHYFLLMTPAMALLAGAAPFALARRVVGARAGLGIAVVVVMVGLGPVNELLVERGILLEASPVRFSRVMYGLNPFPESIEIARYIRERSAKDDRIAVIGSEPQIYFYADRPAATGYIYMYPLMEAQPYAPAMQRHMIDELEAARPKYLVFVNVPTSWLVRPTSDPTLARWFQEYWTHFDRVGVIDMVSRDLTRYRWDAAAHDYATASSHWLAVFRRKD